ncbi:lytic transglycosylase domain-containing protein, partial [Streptomyces hundungensis]|uniref:lytic transglycosylase domain-containing protein n=1 Tax=Streptomyces hundungensis TaxID=1077946 RepID=UPI0033DAE834
MKARERLLDPRRLSLRGHRRLRRGLTGSAVAAVAMAALTASQAPGLLRPAPSAPSEPVAGPAGAVRTEQPSDGAYHTELPPLVSPKPTPMPPGTPPAVGVIDPVWAQEGIAATVLAAYQRAAQRLAGSAPHCHLPWQLLAALGKVESGHAGGGRVDAHGTTLTPILGPVLNGAGFADIADTDHGTLDGDARHDRAVGPMQFIPSTWATWGRDGNDDGRKDPNNVFDASLAAGSYLCADGRDLAVAADLNRAVLAYNHSADYLRTVLAWLEFYRRGAHGVPDGTGVLPSTPGAGSAGQLDADRGHKQGGGIVIGPQPSGKPPAPAPAHPGGSPSASRPPQSPPPSATPSPSSSSSSPTSSPSPSPSSSTSPSTSPSPSPSGGPGVPECRPRAERPGPRRPAGRPRRSPRCPRRPRWA